MKIKSLSEMDILLARSERPDTYMEGLKIAVALDDALSLMLRQGSVARSVVEHDLRNKAYTPKQIRSAVRRLGVIETQNSQGKFWRLPRPNDLNHSTPSATQSPQRLKTT